MKIEFSVRDKAGRMMRKTKKAGSLFKEGFKSQAQSDSTWAVATAAGIWDGLKYKGSLKRGATAGAATFAVIGAMNGLRTLVKNWDEVDRTV